MMGGAGQQPPGGMMAAAGNQQGGRAPAHREREIIWSGELEWQEKVKDGSSDQKIAHSVACTVSTSKVGRPFTRATLNERFLNMIYV